MNCCNLLLSEIMIFCVWIYDLMYQVMIYIEQSIHSTLNLGGVGGGGGGGGGRRVGYEDGNIYKTASTSKWESGKIM